jgi:hypothetical protein
MNIDKNIIGVIYVYQDSEDDIPYMIRTDKDEINYITEFTGKHEYLKSYIEEPQIKIPKPQYNNTYSIFNEKKTMLSRAISLSIACLYILVESTLIGLVTKCGFAWRESLDSHKVGAVLGYSFSFSLIIFGIFIAGILLLAFVNYGISRKETY